MTDQPLKKILHRLKTSRRMLAWSVEINPYCLIYRPWTAIKAQVLVDFIAECFHSDKKKQNNALPSLVEEGEGSQHQHEFVWNLFVDRASSSISSGAGILLIGANEFKVCYALGFRFSASNNMAKYEAFLNEIQIASKVEATDLRINSDSQLVVNQITVIYQVKDRSCKNT